MGSVRYWLTASITHKRLEPGGVQQFTQSIAYNRQIVIHQEIFKTEIFIIFFCSVCENFTPQSLYLHVKVYTWHSLKSCTATFGCSRQESCIYYELIYKLSIDVANEALPADYFKQSTVHKVDTRIVC